MAQHSHKPKEFNRFCTATKVVERKQLLIVMILTGVTMIAEIVAGILTNSLALLSDAFHMFTHFFAVGVSFCAILFAIRKASPQSTFRYWRIEILATLFNGICLIPMVAYIIYQAYLRLSSPEPIQTVPMLIVAVIGLVVNIASAVILYRTSHHDINIKGAFLHMLSDALSSIGVIVAGVIILFTGWYIADPIAAGLISLMIIIWAYRLIRESVHILLESVPRHIEIEKVANFIRQGEKVADVHDIHIWEITSGMYAMTSHIILKENITIEETNKIAQDIAKKLDEGFDITHTCFQFEPLSEVNAVRG